MSTNSPAVGGRRAPRIAVSIVALAIAATRLGAQEREPSEPASVYFEIDAVNPSLQPVEDSNLETPQACVEHFVLAARNDDWRRAAAALDFRLLGDVSESDAAALAERFFYVLNQELWIDWDALPDRPDGLLEGASFGSNDPMAGRPRRNIRLGTIDVGARAVAVNVHRVKPVSGEPVWLFSAHTVDNVDALWDVHGPSWLAKQMPSWARVRGPLRIHVWQWIGLVVSLFVGPVLGFLAGMRISRAIAKRVPGPPGELVAALQWPTAAVIASLFVWVMLEWVLGLPSSIATLLEPMALIVLVTMVVWLGMRASTFVIDTFVKRAIRDYHEEESSSRRRLLTSITIARHVILLVLALIGLAVVLLQVDSFRSVGLALLSSAGAAAVLLGVAGHAVLGNLVAGLQIALVQPFRIGDTVFVEGNWGRIEDITYVDVIVRTWDERRLIFPIGYFVSHWFENWSKTDPFLLRSIYVKVDYRANVENIRQKFIEIVREDEDWASDRDEPEVLVTECNDETMTIRLTCGGADPSRAWSLVCRVRERLMAWLQEEDGGRYLPRRRLVLDRSCGPDEEHVEGETAQL